MKYLIRRHVLNMPHKLWRKLDVLYPSDEFKITPEVFLKEVGLPNGKSALYTPEERAFFDSIYDLWRKKDREREESSGT